MEFLCSRDQPEWSLIIEIKVMAMTYIIILSTLLIVPLMLVWHWIGKALPPASMIDLDCLETRGNEETSLESSESPYLSDTPPFPLEEAQYAGTVTIASTHMYVGGPPPLNTVDFRAYMLEITAILFCVLMWANIDHSYDEIFMGQVLENQAISLILSVIALILALLIGAYRQLCMALLSKAGAIPVLDEEGKPKFAYLGDVPHDSWQHSPWHRACSWLVVAALSIAGALLGAILLQSWFKVVIFEQAFIAIIFIRWLIPAIARFILSRGG